MTIKISGFQVGAAPPPTGIPQYGAAPTYYAVTDGYSDGGSGLPSITWSAPAYSTAIAFVTSNTSGATTDGYMNGWTGQVAAQNNGANWWEYIWVSTLENSTPVTAVSTINNNLNGRSVSVIHALNGIGTVSPVQVGIYQSFANGYSSSSQLNGYNLNNTEFGVLCMGVEGHNYANGNIVSVVSQSGLTWTKKSSKSYYNDAGNGGTTPLFQTCEVWYAKNDTGSDISNDTINITYTGNFDDQTNVIVNFGGVDFNNPWAV
jgi:hypothetical protein